MNPRPGEHGGLTGLFSGLLSFSALAFTGALSACMMQADAGAEEGFRGRFERWYQENPPSSRLPAKGETALLQRFRPVYYLSKGAASPLDFYADYIAHGTLFDGMGRVIAHGPDRGTLNAHARDPNVTFRHHGGETVPRPKIYARVDYDRATSPRGEETLTFLTYTLAFATSGLPAGLSGWQEALARIFADPEDWHQLDHYVNVTLALRGAGDDAWPMAVTFQHHNYLRTWRLGGAKGAGRLSLPDDGRIEVDIAIRSNEAYPHHGGRREWRAASFMDGRVAAWLIGGEDRPLTGAMDITDPSRVLAALPLVALPHSDAFYTFRGSLGEARLLPGRSGPPGADYNTFPGMKNPATQMFFHYWHEEMPDYPARMARAQEAVFRGETFDIAPFAEAFFRDWNGRE